MKDRIWAPWRGEYIIEANKPRGSCFLCDLARAKLSQENLLVHSTEHSYVVLNKFPYNNGHIMIVPKKHAENFNGLTEVEYRDLCDLLKLSLNVLNKVYNPQGCNVGINLGKVAGAGIDDHIHYHIVPRWNGDTNFMQIFTVVKVISEHIATTYDKIFKGFTEVSK